MIRPASSGGSVDGTIRITECTKSGSCKLARGNQEGRRRQVGGWCIARCRQARSQRRNNDCDDDASTEHDAESAHTPLYITATEVVTENHSLTSVPICNLCRDRNVLICAATESRADFRSVAANRTAGCSLKGTCRLWLRIERKLYREENGCDC